MNVRLVSFAPEKLLPGFQNIFNAYDVFVSMNQFNFHCDKNEPFSPPPRLLPVLQRLKEAYLFWYQNYSILPKTHRYSLGEKIDKLFIDAIEAIITANFISPKEKIPYIRFAIRKVDTLKIFLMMLWETKSFDSKKCIALSARLDEAGRMLGGWLGKLLKENSLNK